MVADAGSVNAHYGHQELGQLILDGLRAAGKDPDRLSPDDLAPVDQFHTRGKDGTWELVRLAGLQGGEQVLDVGGGLGGPARTLAHEVGCQVAVLDLTEEYCRVGALLTERSGSATGSPSTTGTRWRCHSRMGPSTSSGRSTAR